MRITWDTDCDAPCIGRIVAEDGRDHLVQTDWDYPGVASSFGWSTRTVQRCQTCEAIRTINPECKMPECKMFACSECEENEADYRRDHPGQTRQTVFPCCDHSGTDGTVDCAECGVKAGDFIAAAGDWLSDNDGAEADDPGYFSE